MELLQLRYFITVAETCSFTEASRRLHISQPALSYQIKRLESELGTPLFHRTSRLVSLSGDGKAFLPLAQDILRKADEALHMMNERLGVERGDVSLGTIPSVASQVIPHLLATFRQSFPGVSVRVSEDGSVDLGTRVLDGELDLAIVSTPSASDALEVTPLISEELFLVVAAGSELARHRSVSMHALQDFEWILPGNAFTLAQLIKEACRRAGFEPKVAYQTGTLESVRSFVSHDLGIGILPRLALQGHDRESLVVLPLEESLTRDLNIIQARDRYASVTTQALAVHIRTTLGSKPAWTPEASRAPRSSQTPTDDHPTSASSAGTDASSAGKVG